MKAAILASIGNMGVRDSATPRKALARPIAVLDKALKVEDSDIVLIKALNLSLTFSNCTISGVKPLATSDPNPSTAPL